LLEDKPPEENDRSRKPPELTRRLFH